MAKKNYKKGKRLQQNGIKKMTIKQTKNGQKRQNKEKKTAKEGDKMIKKGNPKNKPKKCNKKIEKN